MERRPKRTFTAERTRPARRGERKQFDRRSSFKPAGQVNLRLSVGGSPSSAELRLRSWSSFSNSCNNSWIKETNLSGSCSITACSQSCRQRSSVSPRKNVTSKFGGWSRTGPYKRRIRPLGQQRKTDVTVESNCAAKMTTRPKVLLQKTLGGHRWDC